jgi:putative Holliday junction resolvase
LFHKKSLPELLLYTISLLRYNVFMRFLGIDYGTKKIGLALSDEAGRFASPLLVVPAGRGALAKITDICRQEEVEKVIIGQSLDYNGRPNTVFAESQQFATDLGLATGLPVEFESEVLTTKEAERDIGRDKLTDARAAALILKSYIDRHNR